MQGVGAGHQKKTENVTWDQTGYGDIKRAHWGALDRTFPAPYPPSSALSVENHSLGPRVQVCPQREKKCQKSAKPEPATEMAGEYDKEALGTAGAMS